MQFPSDAITTIIDTTGISGTACGTFVASTSTPQTILAANIVNGQINQDAVILIGSSPYIRTINSSGKISIEAPVVFSNQAITCTRINNQSAHFAIVYVPRDIRLQGDISTFNGFSRGEVINGFFLLGILVLTFYAFLFFWIRGIKIKQ